MNKVYVLSTLILIVFCFSFSKNFYHHPDFSTGKTGQTIAGCTCHGPVANPDVTVNLEGLPPNPVAGTTYDLILKVSNTNPGNTNLFAGFDLAATSGTLSTIVADSYVDNGELTHFAPKAFIGNTASWNVRWTAGNIEEPVTFNFAGNNVNNNGSNTGDFWNLGSVNSNIVLPVTLTSFNAISNNTGIKLVWKTEQEINLKQYVIEKSCNGVTFETIAIVTPTANNTLKEYTYVDNIISCTGERVFYRLKIEDLDALFKYSPIVSALIKNKQDLPYAFPNPLSKNSSVIKLYVGKYIPQNIQLYDNNGSIIYTSSKLVAYNNEILLPTNLKPGNYYFKISYKKIGRIVRFIIN